MKAGLTTLIWDLDGTLGYRQGGMFGTALLEVVQRAATDVEVTQDQIRPYLQSGFPWHVPERPHVEIASSEQSGVEWYRTAPGSEDVRGARPQLGRNRLQEAPSQGVSDRGGESARFRIVLDDR